VGNDQDRKLGYRERDRDREEEEGDEFIPRIASRHAIAAAAAAAVVVVCNCLEQSLICLLVRMNGLVYGRNSCREIFPPPPPRFLPPLW